MPRNIRSVEALQYWNVLCLFFGIAFLCGFIEPFLGYRSVGFIFLLGVLAVGSIGSFGPVLFAATLSTLSWNFFFLPPRFTFAITHADDLMMCIAYFVAAVITGLLTTRSRQHEKLARDREERTHFQYEVLKSISSTTDTDTMIKQVCSQTEQLLDGKCSAILTHDSIDLESQTSEFSFPIPGLHETVGLLRFEKKEGAVVSKDQRALLNSVAQQLGLSLERIRIDKRLRETQKLEESERLHQTLLNSISHELRTPLTAILGSASTLEDDSTPDTKEFRKALASELTQATDRLNRVIENLLDMSRLNSGVMAIKKEWHDIHDVTGVVLNSLSRNLKDRPVRIDLPDELPLIEIDFRLFEHAIANLVLNAATYSAQETEITIRACIKNQLFCIEVSDHGPGIPNEDLSKVFEKFYRVPGTPRGGTGLGLSITKGIVEFHKGQVTAENCQTGGALFRIEIPLGNPPQSPAEEAYGNKNSGH